jgi:hypothetical protein
MKPILPILLIVVGCSDNPRVGNPAEPDLETREIVRAWLKENTNTGDWEEVRWWREIDARARKLADCRADANKPLLWIGKKPPEMKAAQLKECDKIKNQPAESAIRLKFRAKNGVGATMLHDLIFTIRDGRVVAAESHYDFHHRMNGWKSTDWFPE